MGFLLNLFLISFYAAPLLTLYPGAQPTAMGGAFCSIADNAYANFYNPAGLAFQNEIDLSFEYNSLKITQVNYWRFAGVLPLTKYSSIGFFSTRAYDQWVIIELDGIDTIGTGKFYEFTPGLAFSYKLLNFISTGIGIKYIQSSLSSLSSNTISYNNWLISRSFAVDIGFLMKYPLPLGKFGFGFAGQHIGPAMSNSANYPLSGSIDKLPITIRAGISYLLSAKELTHNNGRGWFNEWFLEKWRMIIAYDIKKIKEERYWYHSFGVEIRPIPFLATRFGYFTDFFHKEIEGKNGWTVGLGIDLKFLRIDIANEDALYWHNVTPSHLSFSLSINISEPLFPKKGIFEK